MFLYLLLLPQRRGKTLLLVQVEEKLAGRGLLEAGVSGFTDMGVGPLHPTSLSSTLYPGLI